ncbi:MAG: DUF3568 family protein [Planctomycetota bacterium]
MMKTHAWIVAGLSVAALPLSIGGCGAVVAAGAAGAGTYAYLQGDIEHRIDADVQTVWEAVRQSARELELEITKDEIDGLEGRLVANRSDGQIVRINAQGTGSASTILSIRVGLGDKSKSRAIMRRVELALPPGTPPSREASLREKIDLVG